MAYLSIVGTGISVGQISVEAQACIDSADHVVSLVTDEITFGWLQRRNPNTESLKRFYDPAKNRGQTYGEIVEYVLGLVAGGKNVCFALYGHPGVFAFPSHELMRRTKAAGIPSRMLPGISAEDCLFADLGIDPGYRGCQSFEATDFLIHQRRFDPCSTLVLWQFGVIAIACLPEQPNIEGVRILAEALQQNYPPSHEVIVYEAAIYPLYDFVQQRISLAELPGADYSPMSTLLVPPLQPDRQPDASMRQRLEVCAANRADTP